jgi:hypothetical protein
LDEQEGVPNGSPFFMLISQFKLTITENRVQAISGALGLQR